MPRLFAALYCLAPIKNVQAKELTQAGFAQYVTQLKKEALTQGFEQTLIDESFAKVKFHQRAVVADRKQPEKVETLDTYLPKRVAKWKVEKARKLYKKHHEVLREIGNKYGVQPRFIVAWWGLETNFGKFTGNYNVVSALSTLAYEGRREAFFKKQLWAALTILQEKHININNMKGSWAGAMGQNQFMPTSFNAYAIDYNNDGRKDIWTTKEDAFASIANYLKQEGWNDSLTWGRQVMLPDNFDNKYILVRGTKTRKQWLEYWNDSERSLDEWQALGVRRADGTALPNVDVRAALVMPDDINGRMFLAYDNYKVLMHWNRSYYFATSVGYLSDRIGYPKI